MYISLLPIERQQAGIFTRLTKASFNFSVLLLAKISVTTFLSQEFLDPIETCYMVYSNSFYNRVHIIFLLCIDDVIKTTTEDKSNGAMCLLLPGKKLYLQPLLAMKKFRNKGNKTGVITAFYKLESEKLGKVLEISNSRGSTTVGHSLYAFINI